MEIHAHIEIEKSIVSNLDTKIISNHFKRIKGAGLWGWKAKPSFSFIFPKLVA